MKRASLKSNGVILYDDFDLQQPKQDEVKIKIIYAGVCSSDIFRGFESWAYQYPLTMGHELCGTIVEIGEDLTKTFSLGDLVTVFPLLPCGECSQCKETEYARCVNYSYYGSRQDGGFSTHLNVKGWNLLKVPSNVAAIDACLTEPCAVVHHGLKKLGLVKKKYGRAIIIGGGFLGLVAVQMIKKSFPAIEVVVVDRNVDKLTYASDLGAKVALVDTTTEWKNFIEQHKDHFHFVLENTGSASRFSDSISVAASGGTVLWMGNIINDLCLSKNVVSSVLRKELSILGTWNSHYKALEADDWSDVLQFMSDGFQPSKLVSHRIALEKLPETLSKMYLHKCRETVFSYVKVVIENE